MSPPACGLCDGNDRTSVGLFFWRKQTIQFLHFRGLR